MNSVAIRTLTINEQIAEALKAWPTNAIVRIVKTSKRTVENWKQARTGPQAKHVAAMLADDELCAALLTAMGRADIATRAKMVAVLKETLMDRATNLAMAAREMLAFEAIGDFTPTAARNATMETMREVARELGYPGNESEAAIEAALVAARGDA